MRLCLVFILKWATCSTFRPLNVLRDRTKENAMRKIFSLSILLITLLTLVGTADVVARGGRDNDCPPKSSDPDCK